jgi:hypothetical protein
LPAKDGDTNETRDNDEGDSRMFGHPAFTLTVARERHQALIADADRRRLLAVARQARKDRKARKKLANARGNVVAPTSSKDSPLSGSVIRTDGSLTPCRERAAAPAR